MAKIQFDIPDNYCGIVGNLTVLQSAVFPQDLVKKSSSNISYITVHFRPHLSNVYINVHPKHYYCCRNY